MDFFANLALGFQISLSPLNVMYCLVGVAIGTAIGVLPGLGPAATLSLLLPITFRMDMTSAVIMLAGIYYGSLYGGSITSILINIPGEAASVVTCIDGYEMARRGRAGPALGIAAFGSFIAGTFATVGLSLVGPGLARLALNFGPVEFTALVVLGLTLVTYLSQTSVVRSLMMAVLGLMLSTVGLDPIFGTERFTFGSYTLADGFNIAIMAMGLFGIAELLTLAGKPPDEANFARQPTRMRELLPSRDDWRASGGPIARGSVLGFLLGLLPGGGVIIASFASYAMEKRLARHPERFGRGAIEGVAGPESANNAGAQAAFIPLLTLGLPANVVMAITMGALMIHGVTPGPMLIREHADVFWGFVASMYVGNLVLLILNLPLVGLFATLLRIPYRVLYPLIVAFCVLGVYAVNGSVFEVWVMLIMGCLGYLLRQFHYEPAPLVIGLVLAPIFEMSLRQSLILSGGRYGIFLQRPLAAALLALAAALLALALASLIRHARGTAR